MSASEVQRLRVLIANELRDRLELLANVVAGLGHAVIARSVEVTKVGALTAKEQPDAPRSTTSYNSHGGAFMKSFKAAAGLALLVLTFPTAALAHTAAATVSCTGAEFSFQRFSAGSNTVNYKVTVDNNVSTQGTFTLNAAGGSAGHLTVPLTIYGTHEVRAFAWWGPTGTQTGETRPANSPALATAVVHCAAAPLAATPAPASPAPAPAPVAAAPAPAPPAIGVLSETARSAPAVRLAVQQACASRHVRVTVSGRLMSQVRISVSGRHARTVKVKPTARSVTTLVALRRSGPAVQTVTTRITFRNGAQPRRLISPARRCSQVAVAPQFTG